MSFVLNLLEEVFRDVYATRYASLAASTIIIYDHLITLDNEFDLIWKSPWSIGKGLFIINRYYTLASVFANNYALFGTSINASVSRRFYHWQGWTGLIACMIAETILQMRLYALYFLNKRILCLMVGSFIITSASAATIMSIAISQFQVEAHLLPDLPCIITKAPSWFFSFWIPILAFETLLCLLALIRGFRTHGNSGYPVRSDSGKRLVSLLIRDSVRYYVVMFTTYLTCLLVWVINIKLLEVPIGFSIAFSCVLGNRVIFNVRKVNQEMKEDSEPSMRNGKHNNDTDYEDQEFDTITDYEMAQLRSLRAEPIEGTHIVL
ncbi:hypothetical protein F5878DRAFT_30965 [Lentinula raphanica]|uniref:DUF6533 domain-containing protein n=1 Tax=Lentinula raphanica TaxID=153919 RepID=A0AA38PDY5_9AGAR|nr:hypothetical protein F5878DRAFT_30965 [Lentinula raphanica]